jgi:general secretion pathway protein G
MVKRLLNPAALRRHGRKRAGERGFTLMELTAIAIPSYLASVRRAREAALREDLQTLRQAIESYTVDKEKAPQSLDDLVQAGYLKTVPTDPITSRSDTWIVSQSDTLNALTESDTGGISDVHSGAQNLASDGTSYNTW